MNSKMIAGFLIAFASHAFAAPIDFTDVPVLVQELNSDGSTRIQFIDFLQKNPATGNYEPQTTFPFGVLFFGMCLSESNSSCSNSYKLYDQMAHFMAVTSGRQNPEAQYLPAMQNLDANAITTIVSEDKQALKVIVTTKYSLATNGTDTTFLIKKIPALAQVDHQFASPEKDEPNRKPIADVEDKLKSLSNKVVMLQTDANNDDMVGAGGRSQGTGYFISSDGFMMTNHHVIDSFSECMKTLACEVNFSQVHPDGKRVEFRSKVALVALSSAHDFALIKVKLPENTKVPYFEIEKERVGVDLVTLGFPADIKDSMDGKTRLTYSLGRLVGFHNQTYATSNYIFGGASGSPLLNAETLNLVGILSNGTGTIIPGTGAPGLARPIYLIDAEFGISDYLTGTKQKRIKSLLQKVTAAKSAGEVLPALKQFEAEKTFYGLPALKLLMVNHEVKEVRKEIARSLQKMTILIGSKI